MLQNKKKFTSFQLQVFEEIKKIPKGQVITYKELAKRIGRPNAYRAVANACGKNNDPKNIPCHRVIRSDGRLGGYSLDGGIEMKKRLINNEK
ncbi:MAG: MGMT family protein [Hyphomicrobiales bacterium]|jgi:methylated-DNA-[protein]-cysteine S-methyltransferase|nr:MGMT family protein [Alphaproteobacteria bacterium]